MKRRAIIIGGGPAGLTAAYELLEKTDIIPVILEQGSQVGGLSRTIDVEGNKIDIGGHRFFSKSEKVVKWWLKFLPLQATEQSAVRLQYQNKSASFSTVSSVQQGDDENVMLLRSRKSRIYHRGKFYDYPLRFGWQTVRQLGLIRMAGFVLSYVAAKIRPVRPEVSLEDFFRNRFGKALYSTFFEDYTEKVWGVPCTQLPASWGKQRVKGLDIGKMLLHALRSVFFVKEEWRQKKTATSLIEQFLYPKYGPGQLWEKVADAIREKGGEIHLNSRVVGLHGNGSNRLTAARVQIGDAGKEIALSGAFFLSTMPVRELVGCLHELQVPETVKHAAMGLEYRDFLIVGILLKYTAIEATDNWIYLQDKTILAGRMQLFHNWSSGMVADAGNKWIGVEYFCNDTDDFWQKSDKEIADIAIEEMCRVGMIHKEAVLKTVVVKEKKAYPSYFGGYADFDIVKRFLDGIDNVYLIGRNGMHRYNNTDHSMLTAMAAVDNILNGRTDNTNIWDINTDGEYHEEVK